MAKTFFKKRWSILLGAALGLTCASFLFAQVFDAKDIDAAFDRDAYNEYKAREFNSVKDLVCQYEADLNWWMPIALPDTERGWWKQGSFYSLSSFNPAGFPSDFVKNLVPVTREDVAVYPVAIVENFFTRYREIFNAKGALIASVPPPNGYNFRWFVYQNYPTLDSWGLSASRMTEILGIYDQARLTVEMDLILDHDLVNLIMRRSVLAAVAAQAQKDAQAADGTLAGKGGGHAMTMKRSLIAASNIVVDCVSLTNGLTFQISYPDDFTNRLEIYASTNLLANVWTLADTGLQTAGTNTIFWTDTNAISSAKFFEVGDAQKDTDGDFLVDAREKRLHHSNPNSIDSDNDGLVDGYSGIVPTNAYPAGITTNGGQYVEGEMTWGTSPTLFDTDDDGMSDGWEVAHGRNPLNGNDPPNVRGTINYSGGQTGPIIVLAVETAESWATNHSVRINGPGAYRIPNLTPTNYWLKAFVDYDGDASNGLAEAWGVYSTNAIEITNKVAGIDISLADPDANTNNVPDWWEIANFGSLTNSGASDDPDSDQYTNLEEYQAGTDPNNIASHPWNVSGVIAYAGPQTGTIWVIASAAATSWTGVRSNSIAQTGGYTITHLPPNTNYWIWAWRDTDGDNAATYWEAYGDAAQNPVYLSGNCTNGDVTLADPDSDGDGLPDWWAELYGLNAFDGVRSDAVGWWKLDASSGTNVLDSSAYGNHGTLWNGQTSAWIAGVVSNGLRLNGTNSYVQLTNSASLKPSFVSVALWLRPDRDYTNGSTAFFSKRVTGGSAGYSLGYETGKLTFAVCASGAKTVQLPCTLSNGVWRHVTGTYGSQYQRLYVDGVLAVETNYDWGTGSGEITQDAINPRIGATADTSPSNHFSGTLDDVLVFGQELSSNRVAGLYQAGADFDHDGLSNWREFQAGTSPTNSDTDGDGMPDGLEVKYGLAPLSASDALEDRDGDGYLNIYEVLHGGDPTSSNSIPAPTHTITNGAITIQAMINSVTQDYAIVMVKSGTYTGSGNRDIDFGRRNLMLVSETGPSNTIIDCQNAGRGFNFQNGETRVSVLKGLTIAHGKADHGGAILCLGSSPWIDDCTIISNRFLGASGNYGAGLCVDSGQPLVTRSRFVNNGNAWGGTYGGAIAFMDAAVVSNCVISGNTAGSGGGIYYSIRDGAATGTIANCSVVSNSAAVYGGGIYACNDLRIENCLVSCNLATNDGGGLWITGNVRINGAKVESNAGYRGGGIRVDATQGANVPTLVSVDMVDNRANNNGGGLYYNPGNQFPFIVSNCTAVGNTADAYGGIYAGGAIRMNGGCIKGNTAKYTGGMKIYCLTNGPVELSGVEISGNTATNSYCGGLEIYKGSNDTDIVLTDLLVSNNCAASYGHGGIYVHGSARLLMTGCEIVDNTSSWGAGGMYMLIDQTSTISIILNSRFSRNSGHNYAGGLYASVAGQVFVGKSIFENNASSANAGGISLQCAGGPALLLDSVLIGNQAAGAYGAGIVAGGLQNCTIVSNRANYTSGGVSDNGSYGIARNCIAWGNTGAQLYGNWYAEYSCVQGGYTQNGSQHIVTNNPSLVDGYRLMYTNSPCVDAGTTAGISATDIDGKARNSGNAPDIGCSELAFTDSDTDGLLDEWELFAFDDLDETALGDTDGDGLNNRDEYTTHADPGAYDTDRDGMPDGWEWQYGLDPNADNDPTLDSDYDGWTDGQEADQGTDPMDWDTDGDGVEDSLDADPLDPENAEEATPENSCNLTLTVGDSSGSHTEMYLIKVGEAFLRMNYVSGSEYLFHKTVRLPRGYVYDGYVEALGEEPPDSDGDYDADVTSDDPGLTVIDPNGYLGGHHENTGFNSGRRYFQVSLGSTVANTNTAANDDSVNANTIDPINTQNGNVTLSETDVAIPCPGLTLAFGRYYNSRAAVTNGILGPCWAHSYETFLQSRSNATYKGVSGNWQMLSLPQGQEFWFQDNGDGTFKNPPDSNLRLAIAGSGWVIAQAGGAQWTFDANGILTGIADAFSNRVTLTYAGTFPNQRLTRVEHLNGQFLDLSYTGALLTRIDTPVGSLSAQFTYNANNELANAVRNAGGAGYTNRYFYDAGTHSLTQRVNAAGDRFDYGYEYTTNFSGQTVSRGISMTLEPDYYRHTVNYTNRGTNATEVTYSRNGVAQTYVYKYDPVINMIKAKLGPGGTNLGVRYTINGKRDITQETRFDDSIGEYAKSLRSFDTNHNLTFLGFALNTPYTTNWTAYTWSHNLPASVRDVEGALVEFEYTNGLLKTARTWLERDLFFATRYGYTANGLLSAVTNANGHWQRFSHDAYGFMTSSVPQVGPATSLEHNRLGFVTSIAMPWNSGSRATSIGATELGWVTNIVYPDGLGQTLQYDSLGNLTNQIDRAGRTNRLTWLPTGKLASVNRWLDGPNPTNVTTSFAYDNQFNTLTIADPMGRAVERYALDLQDRPVAVTNLEGQGMAIDWGVGNYVRKITRFDGTVVSNSYNADGLLSQVKGPSFTNVFSYYRNGVLKTVANANSSAANFFDLAGRLSSQQTAVGGWTNTVAYQFDPVGNVTNVAVANTPVQFAWTYDEAERPLSLTAQAATNGTSIFQWTYNTNNGLVASVTNSTISEFMEYDVLDRATNIAWQNASGMTVRSFGYTFNTAGMITNVSREDGGWTVYTYDSLDRLTSEKQYASGGGLANTASWTYDLAGNRTMAVTNGVTNLYAYAAGNSLTNFGTGTLVQYDLAGNTTNLQYNASRKLGLKWDGAYQLTEVRTNGELAETYQYDALGRRVSIIAGAVTNDFIYSGPHVVAEYSNNVLARTYAYGPAIDDVLSLTTYGAATNTYFYLKDNLGSVHALVNTNGTVVEQYRYTAWGETTVLNSNGTVLAASAYGNRFTFQGREYSYATRLHFFRSRYYESSLGRWLSKDRIGISGGIGLYEAFGNAPTVHVDPTGRCSNNGDAFADMYWNSLMQNPFSPYNVIARHLGNPAIDIGQSLSGTMFPYMGGPMPPDVLGNVVAGETLTGAYGAGIASFMFVVAEGANVLDPVARARGQLLQDAAGSFQANYTGMGKAWAEHPVHTTALTVGTFTPIMPVALGVNWAADRLGQWSGGGGLNLSW